MGGKRRRKAGPTAGGATINRAGLIVAVVGLVGLFAVAVFLGEPPPAPPRDVTSAAEEPEEDFVEQWEDAELHEIPIDASRDFIRGPADAPVTIVEFTDFQCPYCTIAYEYVGEVLGRYPDDVRLVYKNYPLDMACNGDMARQLHAYACLAAVTARCAGARDPELFWRIHDDIFEGDGLDEAWLSAKTAELGVADEAFEACVDGREEFEEVRADIELAGRIGVNSTPSFYINGRRAPSYEIRALVDVIEHILASN